MDQPTMELAADLRKRSRNGWYWLERGIGMAILFAGIFVYLFWVERWVPDGKLYDAIAVGLISMAWALLDNEIMYRHGRKRRWKEIEAEILTRHPEPGADQTRS